MATESLDGMIGISTSILIFLEGILSIIVEELPELILIVLTDEEVHVHILFCRK